MKRGSPSVGKRGPRRRSVEAEVVDALHLEPTPERPPVPWNRMVLKEEQAAEFLKVGRSTLRKRAAAGEVPRYLVGGEYRYYVYDLLDYVIGGGE